MIERPREGGIGGSGGGEHKQAGGPQQPSKEQKTADIEESYAIRAAINNKAQNKKRLDEILESRFLKQDLEDKSSEKGEKDAIRQGIITLMTLSEGLSEEKLSESREAYLKLMDEKGKLCSFIRKQIQRKEAGPFKQEKNFRKEAFSILKQLTCCWPLNRFDENLQPHDYIILESIDDSADPQVLCDYLYTKDSLKVYFSYRNSYKILQSGEIQFNDPQNNILTTTELEDLEKRDILNRKDYPLPVPQERVVEEQFFQAQSFFNVAIRGAMLDEGEENPALVFRLRAWIRRVRSRFPYFSQGAIWGGNLYGAGAAIFTFCLWATAIATGVTPLGWIVAVAVGLFCGALEYHRRNYFIAFLGGFFIGLRGALTLFLLSYIGLPVIAALGAASLISSAAVATASALWIVFVQPLIPVVAGVVTAVGEYFKPGIQRRCVLFIEEAIWNTPIFIATAVGGLIGGLLSSGVHNVYDFFSGRVQEPPWQLMNNARIYQAWSTSLPLNSLGPSLDLDPLRQEAWPNNNGFENSYSPLSEQTEEKPQVVDNTQQQPHEHRSSVIIDTPQSTSMLRS